MKQHLQKTHCQYAVYRYHIKDLQITRYYNWIEHWLEYIFQITLLSHFQTEGLDKAIRVEISFLLLLSKYRAQTSLLIRELAILCWHTYVWDFFSQATLLGVCFPSQDISGTAVQLKQKKSIQLLLSWYLSEQIRSCTYRW